MPTSETMKLLKQQRLLLQLEYSAEKEAFRKQTQTVGMARKVRRGDAWFPVKTGRSYYNSLNQLVLEVTRTVDDETEHNFEYGRPVMFFTLKGDPFMSLKDPNAKLQYLRFTATVSFADNERMVLVMRDSSHVLELERTDNLGVQLSFDETSYRLMFDAIDRVMAAKDNRIAYLRDLFYGDHQPGHFNFSPLTFPWLNPTQVKAVNEVLRAKDVMVVHGPPGTGKTTTLVEAIYETLRRENQVLVCAQSNMAVDWISEQLVGRGINVLRIGNPTRVNEEMLAHTYEKRFENHPDYPQLWAIRRAIRELRSQRKSRGESYHQRLERLKDRATELELRIQSELFNDARVIACTLTGSANRLLEGRKFGTLFIDEAAQALEAACWIAIKKVSRVVLAGDHCQLPPTIKSLAALTGGLGKTLMERIVENIPECVTLLRVQYRMNDSIMKFPNEYFYKGLVKTSPDIMHRSILDFDTPIEWISRPEDDPNGEQDTFKEQFIGESFGRINKGEALQAIQVMERYIAKIGKQRMLEEQIDIGLISPYRAQVQYLRHLVAHDAALKPFRKLITVNTVDGFQGQERDVIIISLVRSNEQGQIGFLRDLRRMNVAMTRARMKLIILGDPETMTRHPFYKRLYDYIQHLKEEE